ncbi:MAG: bifunctional 2-polyprenyl-6-hydroxyphenol methylase/3-demethylubiquinol 3-O-methyltransferase UbiG [Gammaproteobacteria bacterium]|nr:bifunctional 2-polyprenyl-6-hydroxyphenol methylase/3-demethylubiquinol 3-O-methyltransferase UbiG [Gammaproteobacteria bacterium]
MTAAKTGETTANVDAHEIAKFEALASRWWDPESEFKPLHDINPLRLNYIDRHLNLEGKSVLDVGCGGGILAESMAALGSNVTGIDMGDAPLMVAKLHAAEAGIELNYRKITVEALAEEAPESFDAVSCMEMLEHVPDPASIVEACAKLVKPGGKLFFSTLNRNPKSYLFAIIGAEYVLNMLPKGTHEYAKFIRPAELASACRAADLEVKESTGMSYNPFTKQYRLGQDLSVNYLLYCQKEV